MQDNIVIARASESELESWMELMQAVRHVFPGLETAEAMDGYRRTVEKNILRGSALCALDGCRVVGVLLFSVRLNMLSQMAVHPDYRRRGIGSALIQSMLPHMDQSRDVTVTTFRADDPSGTAPRALYRSLGFKEGRLFIESGHPVQQFVRPALQNII